jgi:3-oxoacyl-[acyl-carrier protein] reductase
VRVAVVFGAGGGLGLALTEVLLTRGWTVVAVDVAGAVELARDLVVGDRTLAAGFDVDPASLDEVTELVGAITERFGPPDAVCNLTRRSTHDASGAGSAMPAFEAIIGLNWWAQVHVAQAFLPGMLGRGRGALVLNAAVRHGGTGSVADYSPANHRIVELASELRGRLRDNGVAVGVTVVRRGARPTDDVAGELADAFEDGRAEVWTTLAGDVEFDGDGDGGPTASTPGADRDDLSAGAG